MSLTPLPLSFAANDRIWFAKRPSLQPPICSTPVDGTMIHFIAGAIKETGGGITIQRKKLAFSIPGQSGRRKIGLRCNSTAEKHRFKKQDIL